MPFFKKLFTKKYPKNKIDTDEDPIDVYAGPEPDGPGEPQPAKKEPQPIKCVYAGPRVKKTKRPPIEAVYAGPRRPQNKAEPMECVYAGPEYFAPKDDRELLVICDNCGAENKYGAETCEKCGEKL